MIPDVNTSTLRDFTSAKELGHGWKNTFDRFQAMITIMKKGVWIGEGKGEEIGTPMVADAGEEGKGWVNYKRVRIL